MIVQCEFNSGGRQYSYECDIEVKIGDKVIVENKEGEKTVTVVGLEQTPLPYALKKVLRKKEIKPTMSFETEFALEEWRAREDQYIDMETGKAYSNETSYLVIPQMQELINLLEADLKEKA